tara:strand:+ start:897 stop:1355 length:459 start_codon:yes stop_codon:yes gene_type:complete
MAQINSYPIEVPTTTDLIPFSDVSEGNTTKSATVQSIANLANAVQLGYTSLVQLLTQTGTNAPVATEVYNNTGQTFTWSYVSTGVYRITSTGAPFTVNKTVVFANPGAPGAVGATIQWNLINSSTIELTSLNLNATTNGLITGGSFEIKIYN